MKKILTSALWGALSILCLAGVLTGHTWHIGTGLICITMTLACLPTKEELYGKR